MPLLFALDINKKHDVLFKYDTSSGRWYVDFDSGARKTGEKEGEALKGKKRKEQAEEQNSEKEAKR